jgi:hypothetical protein
MNATESKTTHLEFRWTVSRGRDTYGYNICSLYADGRKVSSCNGGGYDMKGTALGSFIAHNYADRLNGLRAEDMEPQSHWEPNPKPGRCCENESCTHYREKMVLDVISRDDYTPEELDAAMYVIPSGTVERFPDDQALVNCPHCGEWTRPDSNDGKRVDDGRYFYGLSFHDPNYDPGKAIIGKDCNDRTLSNDSSDGKTVEQAESDGVSFGLERLQAAYTASSKVPTDRHTVPSIDGACGVSSVERIMKAIGLTMEYLPSRKKNDQFYVLHDSRG